MAIDTLMLNPLKDMALRVVSVIPTLLSVFVVLVIGLLLAKLLHDVLSRIFKEIHLDKLADKVGISGLLHKGGVKGKMSDVLASGVYLVTMVMFIMVALDMIGMTGTHALLGMIMGYIPQVILASVVLFLGMVVSKIVGHVLFGVASNFGMPHPEWYNKISYYAIMIYTIKMVVEQLGFGFLFVGTVFHIWFAGLVLGLSLAYGLRGHSPIPGYFGKEVKK